MSKLLSAVAAATAYNMKVALFMLCIACCASAVTAAAQAPVKTGGGWAFTCKNGVPVYDGSGTAPTADGSCKVGGGGSSSGSAQSEMLEGAFNAGVAVNQWLANIERQGMERRAARERARVAAEIARREQFVRDSIDAARAREEAWRRLSSQFQFSTQPALEMRLGSPAAEIGFRFDGEGERRDLSNAELAARNATACTFMASCGEKTVMPELGDPMVVDLRHLRRAAHLLRQTEYGPAEQRESALNVALELIEGRGPEFDVPSDAPELPAEAASEVGAATVERKAATAERMQRAAAVDTVAQRRETLGDVEELARADQTLSAAERAQLLGELARQRSALDSALAQARLAHQRAEQNEAQAIARQRTTLYRVVRFQGRQPGPPTRRSRGAPRWSLASASELTVEIKGEVSVYAAEPLVDNPAPRLPPPIEATVRQRLTPDVLYVTGPTGVMEVSAPDKHRLEVRSNTRIAVDDVPLSTDTPATSQPVSLSLIRGSMRWWSTFLNSECDQARLIRIVDGFRRRDHSALDDLYKDCGIKPTFNVRTPSGAVLTVRGSDVEFFVSPGNPERVRVNAGILVITGFGSSEDVMVVGGETATIGDLGVTVAPHPPAN